MRSSIKKYLFIANLMLHGSGMASEAADVSKRVVQYHRFFSTKPFCRSLNESNGWNWPVKEQSKDTPILTPDEKKVSQWIIDNSSCVKRDKDFMLDEDEEYLYEQGSQRDLPFVNQQDNQIRPLDNKSMKYNFSIESESLANYWDLLRQGIVGLYEGQLGFVHDLFSSKQAAKIQKAFDRSNFKKRRPGLISPALGEAVCLLLNKEIDASITKWKEAIKTVEEKLNDYLSKGVAREEELGVSKSNYDLVMQLREVLYYFLTITMAIQKDKSRIEEKEISLETIKLIDVEQSYEMNDFLKRIENVGFLERYFFKKKLIYLKKMIQAYIATTPEQKEWDKKFIKMKEEENSFVYPSASNAYEVLKTIDIHLANMWQAVHTGLILKKHQFANLATFFLDETLRELNTFEKSFIYSDKKAKDYFIKIFRKNSVKCLSQSSDKKCGWGKIFLLGFVEQKQKTRKREYQPWRVLEKVVDFFNSLFKASDSQLKTVSQKNIF